MFLFSLLFGLSRQLTEASQIQNIQVKESLNVVNTLVLQDLYNKAESPFLVFLYYEKQGFYCPVCEEFKASISQLEIPVKALNFTENVELSSRFLQHSFPAFIIRHNDKSYVLDPKSVDDLKKMISDKSWLEITPVKKRIDVNSYFAIVFSKINRVIFFGVTGFHYLSTSVPDYFVTLFIVCVITFLIYSIVDVLMTEDPKIKQINKIKKQ